jgi:hypothetical protein
VTPRIDEALARAAADGINDPYQLGQLVRRTVRPVGQRELPPPAHDHPVVIQV